MGGGLNNPEARWQPGSDLVDWTSEEVTGRLRRRPSSVRLLSGGLANTNLLVDGSAVLRIYRRDPGSATKEAVLLRRPWRALRVPEVLAAGGDWLLLEYVPHRPLSASEAAGRRLGRALAEIHATRYETAGFLDASLRVAEPLTDHFEALCAHIRDVDDRQARWRELILETFARHRSQLCERFARAVLLHGDFKLSNLHATRAAEGLPLVLDWEFAYAGPPSMDVGQLFRWPTPAAFQEAFAAGYRAGGATLPPDWLRWSRVADLGNLAGLLDRSRPGSRREADVRERIEQVSRVL